MALVHDNHVPEILVLAQVELTHGLDGGERDASSDVYLPTSDSPEKGFVQIPFSSVLALT